MTTAKHRALDALRRRAMLARKHETIALPAPSFFIDYARGVRMVFIRVA
jgi:hypothetical protein